MEILDRMPWAAQNAVFQRLAEVAEVSKLSKEDRLAYDHAMKRYRDTYNAMTGAELKGRAEGRAEGMAQGIEENKRENARKMKAKGYQPPVWGVEELQPNPDFIGLKGSPTRVAKVFAPPVKTNRVRLDGTPAEQAAKLVGILEERHLV